MKLTRALIPVALASLLLAGCSTGSDTASTGGDSKTDCVAAGSASKSIKVKGETGTDLEITSKAPVTAEKLERSVLTEGKGKQAKSGQTIEVAMTMFNGADGKAIQQVPSSPVPLIEEQLAPWAFEGIKCGVPGEQVAIVAPYADVFGSTASSEIGVEGLTEKDSVVVVMEFGEVADAPKEPGTLDPSKLLKKAEGKAVAAPKGFPEVKLAENGEPTITIPKGVDAPKELSIATVIEGDGETVKPGDRVYVNYRGVIWSTGKEFDSSWSRGEPAAFTTDGVIGGFQKALEGQKVGSQIISIVPAEDGGYGGAQLEKMGHKKDDVMVFVLDILGTAHAE